MRFIGFVAEAQLDQTQEGTHFSAFRTHARLYIDVNRLLEIYPLAGISKHYDAQGSGSVSGVDVGIGLDLNLTDSLSIGGRYLHTFYNEDPAKLSNGQSREDQRFLAGAQLTIYF